jgi:hypothetical protein
MKKLIYSLGITCVILTASCYYDVESVLYGTTPCDNSIISYNGRIKAILDNQCSSCHGGANPSAGIALDNYLNSKAADNSGLLNCTIAQEAGCSPMPKGGSKLSQCDIDACSQWASAGYPEN